MTVLFFVPKKSSTNLGPIEYVYGRSSFVCGEKDKIFGTSESHLGLVVTRDLKKGVGSRPRCVRPLDWPQQKTYNSSCGQYFNIRRYTSYFPQILKLFLFY